MKVLNKLFGSLYSSLFSSSRIERIWKLAEVDFKKRYYNDKLGLLWALINPLIQISIYYLVFVLIIKYDKVENYALFLFSGILVWMTFTESSKKGIMLIKNKRYLIENIQFNKLDLFYSQTMSIFIGFIFNIFAYFLLSYIMGIPLGLNALYFPILIINLFFICLGAGLILSVIQIYLKDIIHIWNLFLLLGFWTSGIFFRGQAFIELFPPILYINPFIGLIINSRKVLLDNEPPDFFMMAYNMIFGIVLCIIGSFLFKRNWQKAIEKF